MSEASCDTSKLALDAHDTKTTLDYFSRWLGRIADARRQLLVHRSEAAKLEEALEQLEASFRAELAGAANILPKLRSLLDNLDPPQTSPGREAMDTVRGYIRYAYSFVGDQSIPAPLERIVKLAIDGGPTSLSELQRGLADFCLFIPTGSGSIQFPDGLVMPAGRHHD
jgi:hypothetical protein